MLFTLITGFVVGMFFEKAGPYLENVLERAKVKLSEAQLALVCFALCLAVASALLNLIGVDSYPVLLCVAAACGVAKTPLMERFNQRG